MNQSSSTEPLTPLPRGGFWRTPRGTYDFARPRDNVEAFVRLHADLGGRLSYLYGQGGVFAALAGRPLPLRLCDFEVLRVNRFVPLPDGSGYRHVYTWSMYLTDPSSGLPLERFRNPLNGKEGIPRLAAPAIVERALLPEGVRYFDGDGRIRPENPYSNDHLNPFILDWAAVNDTGWVHVQTPFEMRGASWNDSWHYTFAVGELDDRSLQSVPVLHSCSVNSSLYPWMGFEEQGFLRWFRYGGKCDSPAGLPAQQRENILRLEPGFFGRLAELERR